MATRRQLAERRLFNQFSKSTDMKTLISILLDYVEYTDDIIESVLLERFKDTSEGVWLDIVAEIVGIYNRPAEETDPATMFTYRDLSQTKIDSVLGYGNLVDPTDGGKYRSLYGNVLDTNLTDTDFLVLVNAKIAANNAGPSIPAIYDYIELGFGAECDDIQTDIGFVEIYLKQTTAPYLTDFDRRTLVQYAPVQSGTRLVIRNWQTMP